MKIFIAFSLAALTNLAGIGYAASGDSEISTQQEAPVSKLLDPQTKTLTLAMAIQKTLAANARLKAQGFEMEAFLAEARQAGGYPNPELELGMEEFAGRRERSGFGGSEASVLLSQKLLLGKKRRQRLRLATLKTEAARLDRERLRQDLIAAVSKAFVEVLAAQDRFKLAGELVSLAQQTHQTVAARVEAGKVSPLQATKSKVANATAKVRQDQAQFALVAARQNLAVFWGETQPTFDVAAGVLRILVSLPDQIELAEALPQNPDLARLVHEKDRSQAFMDFERAESVPDLTVSAGAQRFQADDAQAYVMSISVPLNLFNRNKGRIQAASHRIAAAAQRANAGKTEMTAQLMDLFHAFKATHLSATSLKNDILPAAQWAFEAASEGYREGKFGFLEVLDAQRTLFQTKAEYLEILATYQTYLIDIQRLVGMDGIATQNLMQAREGEAQ